METTRKSNSTLVKIEKNICEHILLNGKRCKAQTVGPNTPKKGTREFLDGKFCQMHQPGKIRCVCSHCPYHRIKDMKIVKASVDISEDVLENR